MKFKLLFLLLLIHKIVFAQKLLFESGDRVCFVGNSITHGGEFHHNILLFQITRFPNERVDFFNNGISGDVTGGILKRMDSDILIHQPTHCIIMIGMNDVKRNLYGSQSTNNTDTLRLRKDALEIYKKNLEEIINKFLSRNIKVILQKPSIYDQTAVLKTPNNLGVNDALKECADFAQILANKYQLKTIDYWSIMKELNAKIQKIDPSATIVSNDRVHPGAIGHLIMSYQFLKSTDSPKFVSSIVIAKNKKDCQNCEVTDLIVNKKSTSFSVVENSLPFPISENQKKGLDLVNFMDELNTQNLQFTNLKKGNYELIIDGVKISKYNQSELKKGINLAQYPSTPQYQQALVVQKTLGKLWENESNLRAIKWTELNQMGDFENKYDLDAARKYLNQRFEDRYKSLHNANYYKSQFEKYFIVKPNENQFISDSEALKNRAFEEAKPQKHLFVLNKID
jgi:lysophospholipase L1-like esterase